MKSENSLMAHPRDLHSPRVSISSDLHPLQSVASGPSHRRQELLQATHSPVPWSKVPEGHTQFPSLSKTCRLGQMHPVSAKTYPSEHVNQSEDKGPSQDPQALWQLYHLPFKSQGPPSSQPHDTPTSFSSIFISVIQA